MSQPASQQPWDVVVIGAGPAGCSCGLWLHKMGWRVLLLDQRAQAGGQMHEVPYPSNWTPWFEGLKTLREAAVDLHKQMVHSQVPMHLGAEGRVLDARRLATGLWEIHTPHASIGARMVVVATGSSPRSGGLEPSPHLVIGAGAPIERVDLRGKRVAILGGGDNAFENHAIALQRGAASVVIFSRSKPKARASLQRDVPTSDVRIGPVTIEQAPGTGLRIAGEAFDLAHVLFGYEPNTQPWMRGLVQLTPKRLILADLGGATSQDRPGAGASARTIWACGEVTSTFHPSVPTAMGHGVQTAVSIDKELRAFERKSQSPPRQKTASREA